MTSLFTNIKSLLGTREENVLLRGAALAELPKIDDAYLVVEDGVIAAFGAMSGLKEKPAAFSHHFDLRDRYVLPAWCDSHTHLVFAGSREAEFVDKIRGLSYAEIAAKGGGILNSSQRLNDASENELFVQSYARLQEVMKLGTGAIEIKSGYGLNLEGELKMLRVIRRLKEKSPIPIKATFLGAHALPQAYKENREAYLQLITDEMLPAIGAEKLADYIDVFCEQGFFTPEETEMLCKAGKQYGLKPKLHVNQLNSIGGVQAGIRQQAVSLDHLETMAEEDIHAFSGSQTVATLLPTAAFFLRMPFQPARKLIEADAAVALASDFNPGSSPSGNMNFVVSLSCIQMRMLPAEAINAATVNGAFAMELQQQVGSISVGKRANFIVTKPVPSVDYLPYAFGSNLIEKVFVNGEPA